MTTKPGIKLVIPGRPPAKSNRYRIVRVRGFPRLALHADVAGYEQLVCDICQRALRFRADTLPYFPVPEMVELVLIWHRSGKSKARKDLDNILKSIEDGLTAGGMWTDDHQVTLILLEAVFDTSSISEEWVEVWVSPRQGG